MLASTNYPSRAHPSSKRSNMHLATSNSRMESASNNDQSDFEIVVQFELRREREKTRILQQRLHNKQVFIQQMKECQDQLTIAFEKCQEELMIARKTIKQMFAAQRDYQEEIAELKHLIIRLEDEINLRDKDLNRRHYSSVKNENIGQSFKKRSTRAKTLMNNQEDSPQGFSDLLEGEVVKQSRKITKFIKQFLMMSDCFCQQSEQKSLKNRLKTAWKWIKQVVKEWNDLNNQKQLWNQFFAKLSQKTRIPSSASVQQKLNKVLLLLQQSK